MKLLYTLCNIIDRLIYGKPTKEQQSLRDYLVNELDSGKWDDETKSVSSQYHPFHIAGEYYSVNLHDLTISIGNQKVKWFYGVGDIFQAVKRSYKRQQQIDKMKVFNKQRDIWITEAVVERLSQLIASSRPRG